ncbi:cysteine desulfurase [Paenibacillus sp. UNCCL117]|uniref:cysteine desulfurase family protein n=1 Tax=unclassified Paenibacillus TaxID=185978 RepID=UPI000886D877|nr:MULTISPECIES: cysteine desulfurase family protein [unclassified Paenibacillus]SDC73038.1 cysteine desulfurase [Paenibacillus sp. cl123]SFW24926.1 cysteine desulfurase [Paenibacillus sp. UNCCL117]
MLYMDYAATTPMHPEVIDAMTEVMRLHYGNPSSLHKLGVESELLVRRSRETIAAALRCKPGEIRFTSGGTEGNNAAIRGTAYKYRHRGNHLIASAIEHPSVHETLGRLEKDGFRVTYVPVSRTGHLELDKLQEALTEDTILVSLMLVNNEIGSVQPVRAVGELLRGRAKTVFHVDAVQAIGKLPVVPSELGADLLTGAAHKLGGPKGAGLLYVRSGLELEPQLTGGGQEFGLRSGTENVPAIVGMAKAIRIAVEKQPHFLSRTSALREGLIREIRQFSELVLTGEIEEAGLRPEEHAMAPHIVHFAYPGMKSEVLVHAFEQQGICVSARSACSSGAEEPSRVMLAMGCNPEEARSGIRISYSAEQEPEETAAVFGRALAEVMKKLRPQAVRSSGRGRRR